MLRTHREWRTHEPPRRSASLACGKRQPASPRSYDLNFGGRRVARRRLLRSQRVGGPDASGRASRPEPDRVDERDRARDDEQYREDREDDDWRYSEAVGDSAPDDVPEQHADGNANGKADG